MKTLRDFDLEGKRVLVRCDFNVPLSDEGNILDDFRIEKTIPTIEFLRERGAKIILLSHLGRPQGELLNIRKYSLRPLVTRIEQLLKAPVFFIPDCLGENTKREIEQMGKGDVVLLENLRFYKEEEKNDSTFAQRLASFGEIFINDAFSVCHRVHASVVSIPKHLPSGVGFLLEKEIKVFTNLMEKPRTPLVGIIGGSKVETKVKLIDKISEIADLIMVGGLMEKEIEEKNIQFKNPQKIIKPIDYILTFDIGPKTINLFKENIKKAKTVFWSGPLGKIEEEKYRVGSREIAQAIIDSSVFSIVGGGETMEFINALGWSSNFNHISTGGGAMLTFLSGEKLPGIEALA